LDEQRPACEKFAAVDDVQRQIQGLPLTVPDMSGPVLRNDSGAPLWQHPFGPTPPHMIGYAG
jgi:hypothetical protein